MFPIRNTFQSRYPPVVTWMLIAPNCLVFLLQDSVSPYELEQFLRQFALIPAYYAEVLASGEADLAAVDMLPFLTMMFLHVGWLHLVLNMRTLWLFGPTIEDRLCHDYYLAFYLGCGLAASVERVLFNRLRYCRHWVPPAQSPAFSEPTCACFRWYESCDRPDPVHPADFRSLRVHLYRSLVPAADFRRDAGLGVDALRHWPSRSRSLTSEPRLLSAALPRMTAAGLAEVRLHPLQRRSSGRHRAASADCSRDCHLQFRRQRP
jgi:Rhomboid family